MINILIVDDHLMFAEGLASMFKPEDQIKVVAHTTNGNEVPSILTTHEIDIILMDLSMPIIDGIDTMQLIKQKGFDVPILMLTMHQAFRQIKAALEKGAQGYIVKDASAKDLKKAIELTSKRETYFHPAVNEQVFNYLRGKKIKSEDILSEREVEIIKCLAEGLNTKDIADQLFISEHTVKTHRRNIMHKMNVKTSAELVKKAIDSDLI